MHERVRTILNAYLAASVAAGVSFVLGYLLVFLVGLLFQGRWQAAGSAAMALPIFPLMLGGWIAFFVVVLAFVPALGFIAVAEATRTRAAAFYGIAGIGTAIVCWSFMLRKDGEWFGMPGPGAAFAGELTIVGAAGLIAGLVYWAIAGRTAGNW